MAAYISSDEDEPIRAYPLPIFYASDSESDVMQTLEDGNYIREDRNGGNSQRGNFRNRGRSPRQSSRGSRRPITFEDDNHLRDDKSGGHSQRNHFGNRGRPPRQSRGRSRGSMKGGSTRDGRAVDENTSGNEHIQRRDNQSKYRQRFRQRSVTRENVPDNNQARYRKDGDRGRGRGLAMGGVNDVLTNRNLTEKHNISENRKRNETVFNASGLNENRNRSSSSGPRTRLGHPDTFKPQTITFSKIRYLSSPANNDPDKLLLEIVNKQSGFKELLETPINHDWLYNILQILSKAITSTHRKSVRELLLMVETHLLSKVTDTLNDVSMKSDSTVQLYKNLDSLSKLCIMIIELLKATMESLHSSLGKCKGVISALNEVQSVFSLDTYSEVFQVEMQTVQEVFDAVKETIDKIKQEKQGKKTRQRIAEEDRLPPEDFRELSILPNVKDLNLDEKPFLRANKAEGKYEDLDTYLDIQFRLLREDYIQPLRNGLSQYQYCLKQGESVRKLREIRLYNSVQILRPICSSSGINYILQFDTSDFKRMNWAASRRLLYGSLVCLSRDDFETNYYATVTERKDSDLGEGLIQVQFEEIPDVSANEKFVMVETTAFFEAYRYILEGLQEMDSSMPFQSYIVSCNTHLKPPKYLLEAGGPKYDFSCLLSSTTKSAIQSKKSALYPVLNTARWPEQEQLGFDESQYDAIKLAITKEISIIQGPPGTGKTFIGLKITRLLMTNKNAWNSEKTKRPILVVCYTNHALDQFLEGILQFCQSGIVRIGGRCKNEALEPFILRNLKQKRRENKNRSWGVRQNEKDCLAAIAMYRRTITEISSELKRTSTDLITFEKLQTIMSERQLESLKSHLPKESPKYYIPIWLQVDMPSVETNGKATEITDEEKMKEVWKLYILDDVTEFSVSERNVISDICMLDLYPRAQLYKAWVSEYIFELESNIAKIALHTDQYNTHNLNRVVNVLDKEIEQAKTEIVSATKLYEKITNLTCQRQLLTLCSDFESPIPMNKALEIWLSLDGSVESMVTIQFTLDQVNMQSKVEPDEVSDLEEERELDDDDNEFLFDYTQEGKRQQTKTDQNVYTVGEWFTQWSQKKMRQKVRYIFSKARDLTDKQAEAMTDLWTLPMDKRRDLYRHWILRYRSTLRAKVQLSEIEYNNAAGRLKEVRDHETIELLKEADFIGMTTTGAAKNRSLLQKVCPCIIIVEEAAEVLESHIITTLNKDCQHLILIGDHKQLRPSTTVYELAKKYHLDISLFERMIRNGVLCVTLSEQHRMRPEISALMRYQNLYPNLKDHSSVRRYEDIQGIDSNFQFIDHEHEEATATESTSYSNPHEASFIAVFCKYILQQGYTADQITVLTPYMGQVFLLRKKMPKAEFEGVRITAVDNYQGEENDIIILSLVRSSTKDSVFRKRNPIGFLGIENRICVALSRAKKGFYVIGNFTLLTEYSEMWRFMSDHMKNRECLNKIVTLRCQNHPDKVIRAETVKDFEQAPEGGCKESCDFRLKCGHLCTRFCHIIDKEHAHVKCFKSCPKKCGFGHRCKRKCWQKCGKCPTMVEKIIPMCGHMEQVPCHKDPHTCECTKKCEFILPCKHVCNRDCKNCIKDRKHEDKCQHLVTKKLICGHEIKLKCFQDPILVSCSFPCQAILDCKHSCTGSCGECCKGKIHRSCKKNCTKTLPCGHKCSFPCSDLCPPCNRKCEWECSHSMKCTKLCSEECDKCTEICRYKCTHRKCQNLCYENCKELECNERCKKAMKCQHPCKGLCGEKCPNICDICDTGKQKKDNSFSTGEDSLLVKLPDCGCTIDVQRMDRWISEETGVRDGLYKRCPDCKKIIRKDIKRYTNCLKKCRTDIANKFKSITGTEQERKNRKSQLKIEIDRLKHLGLDDKSVLHLQKRLEHSDKAFGILNIIGKTTTLLSELLKVSKSITELEASTTFSFLCRTRFSIKDTKGIVPPGHIQAVLIKDMRYCTKQFWNEVQLEINRLELLTKFRVIENTAADFEHQELYDEGMGIITDEKTFTKESKEQVEAIYKRLKERPRDTYV